MVVIGITYGGLVGLFGNWLLFRKLEANKQDGVEPLKGLGWVFFLRYGLDAISLLTFAYVTKNAYGITAAAISITVAVKISLIIAYTRKGGRFD